MIEVSCESTEMCGSLIPLLVAVLYLRIGSEWNEWVFGPKGARNPQTLPDVALFAANSQPVLPDRAKSCRFPIRNLSARVEQLRGIAGWDARSG